MPPPPPPPQQPDLLASRPIGRIEMTPIGRQVSAESLCMINGWTGRSCARLEQ